MTTNILVVDDDASIRSVIRMALEDAGFCVSEAENGKTAVVAHRRAPQALVILDIGMPELDGFETCIKLRKFSAVPVLFLTARDEEIDRVLGFQLGGDDYVTKPFSPRELVLRVRAILARARPRETDTLLVQGDLSLRMLAHEVELAGQVLELTATEFALLNTLMTAAERVFTRDQIITSIYGANNVMSDRTIDSHIRNLRHKAQALGYSDIIRTIHGVGLRLGSCTT